jgi:selenide,water dikinase
MSKSEVKELIICGGCNAKIGPDDLGQILASLPRKKHDDLLVGFDSSDDAAIVKVTDELALVQTLDFFPAMVRDPYLFGKIAAANALSDVYAMGGEVMSALNVVCFPESEDLQILKQILLGGAEKVAEAGGILAGGHSIHDSQAKYGLSVTGKVHPGRIWMNNAPQVGDCLVLTKPLGVGIITTAYSIGEVSEDAFLKAVASMETLNKYATEVARDFTVHSCTDITGFGLLGHLSEMLNNQYTAVLNASDVPMLPEAYASANEFLITAGGQRNRNHLEHQIKFINKDFAMEEVLFDPQTSGGLLFSVPKVEVKALVTQLNQLEIKSACIGEIVAKQDVSVIVH